MWPYGEGKEFKPNDPAIKNLNVYDILEPNKVEYKNNVHTAVLVDISDGAKSDLDLNGSLLDKIKKSEYTLVDLFENMYVSPQHVSKNGENALEIDFDSFANLESDKFDITPLDKGYTCVGNGPLQNDSSFIKKLENDLTYTYEVEKNQCTKIEDCNQEDENIKHLNRPELFRLDESENHLSEDKKVSFDELFDRALSSRYPNLEELSDSPAIEEDLIDEFLTTKIPRTTEIGEEVRMTSRKFDKSTVYTKEVNRRPNNFPKLSFEDNETGAIPNAVKVPNSYSKLISKDDVESVDILNSIQRNKTSELKSPIGNRLACQLFSGITSKLMANNFVKDIKKPRNVFQPDSVTRYRLIIKSNLIDINKSTLENQPILKTMKNDSKLSKRKIFKRDSEKAGYTKGPGINEKSIVLPQIMQRLSLRNEMLDASKNVKRKFILDKGMVIEGFKTNLPVLAPEVLMEDCNKERLRALKTRVAFDNFVNSGSRK